MFKTPKVSTVKTQIMDKQEIEKCVAKMIKQDKVLQKMKLEHWKINFIVEPFKEEGEEHYAGLCDNDPSYHIATILLNPVYCNTEDIIKTVVIHELCHLLLAGVQAVMDAYSEAESDHITNRNTKLQRITLEQTTMQLEEVFMNLIYPKSKPIKKIKPKPKRKPKSSEKAIKEEKVNKEE